MWANTLSLFFPLKPDAMVHFLLEALLGGQFSVFPASSDALGCPVRASSSIQEGPGSLRVLTGSRAILRAREVSTGKRDRMGSSAVEVRWVGASKNFF